VYPHPSELLPHSGRMVLPQEVLDFGEGHATVALTVAPDSLFFEPGLGVPAHVGIEWMAQACGCYAGLEALRAGLPIRMGFLLGTRRYHANRSYIGAGERAVISVRQEFRDDGMAVFTCRIDVAGAEVVSAQLTLYQPDDPSQLLGNPVMRG
jgi:predicted hotdog family 3-hydroxylacyl-ACP dehydratase